MKKSKNINRTNNNKKIVFTEYNYSYASILDDIIKIFLFFYIGSIILFFATLNTLLIIAITFMYSLIIILLLSNKNIYLTIYENGINFPQLFLNSLRKEKLFYFNEISQVSVDNKNKSIVILLKSGEEYNFNNTAYYKTDHVYPILKNTLKKFEDIKFIDPM